MKRIPLFALALALAVTLPAGAESLGVLMSGGAVSGGAGDPDGLGFVDLILSSTGIFYSVQVVNVEMPITAMHIHEASSGAIVATFTGSSIPTAVGTNPDVPQSMRDAIASNPTNYYFDVHTSAHPQGAVRGTVQFAYYLPVVGRAFGGGGTNWVTRMAMINLSDRDTSNGFFEFFPQSQSGTATRSLIQQEPLPPLDQRVLNEVPAPQISGIGALKIFADQHTAISARILNDRSAQDAGTAGFAVDAMKLEDAAPFGELPFLITSTAADVGLGNGFRTNIGYFNPQVFTVEAFFEARSNDGTVLGTARLSIPPGAMVQTSVESLLGLPEARRDGFYVFWSSSARTFVYASVVDNKTGDSVFINGASRRF